MEKIRNALLFIIFTPLIILLDIYLVDPLIKVYDAFKGYIGNSDPPNLNDAMAYYKKPIECVKMLSDKNIFMEWLIASILIGAIAFVIVYILKNLDIHQEVLN